MSTPPTGSNIVLYSDCNVEINIVGNTNDTLGTTIGGISTFSVLSPKDFEFSIQDRVPSRGNGFVNLTCNPLFFEQQFYKLTAEVKNGSNVKIRFRHISPEIMKMVSGKKDETYFNVNLNFKNDIGFSDLSVDVIEGGRLAYTITFKIEVFPKKIDYKKDYLELMDDVAKEVFNILYDYVQTTYRSFSDDTLNDPTLLSFFSKIQVLFDSFYRAAQAIIKNPHRELIKEYSVVPARKAKSIDSRCRKWISTHPDQVKLSSIGIDANKILSRTKIITNDTPENRFVKYILVKVRNNISTFKHFYEKKNNPSEFILSSCDSMKRRTESLINSNLFSQIEAKRPLSLSMVFRKNAPYNNLYKIYLVLSRGLNINCDVFDLSVKDVAKLYEVWCFIKLNSLLRTRFKLKSSDIIKVKKDGLVIRLLEGQKSSIRYSLPYNDSEFITIGYNVQKNNLPTTSQRPDNILSLRKTFSNGRDLDFIFDAKYKLSDDPDYLFKYQHPGPTEDDINTMHRYKDSVVDKNGNKSIHGAYVLFPLSGENNPDFESHHFYQSIEKTNVGALPFLPSRIDFVDKHLENIILMDDIVMWNSIRGYDKNIEFVLDEKVRRTDHLSIPAVDVQFYNYCIANNVVPVSINEWYDPTIVRTISLRKIGESFGYDEGITEYSRVLSFSLKWGKELSECLPTNEMFYAFVVDDWETLMHKVNGDSRDLHDIKLISLAVLKNCIDVNSLDISDYTELVVYRTLRRYFGVEPVKRGLFLINGHLLAYSGSGLLVDSSLVLDAEKIKGFLENPRECLELLSASIF